MPNKCSFIPFLSQKNLGSESSKTGAKFLEESAQRYQTALEVSADKNEDEVLREQQRWWWVVGELEWFPEQETE